MAALGERATMPRKIRELKADLQRAGFASRTAKGSHTFWTHPRLPSFRLTLAGHDGDDAKSYQEAAVRDARLRLEEAQR
jgi:predicted RNA binding protein YcfA (HicA-like mRNA interferase family)